MRSIHILKELSKTLHEGENLQRMFQRVLEKTLELTRLDTGWIFMVEGEKQHLVAHSNLPEGLVHDQFRPMCEGSCWCVDRLHHGKLQGAVNILECRRLERAKLNNWGSTAQITHHATIPIRAGDRTYGLMNVAASEKFHFQEEELEILEVIAYQMGAAVHRIQLLEEEKLRANLFENFNQWVTYVNKSRRKGIEREASQSLLDYFSWSGLSLTLTNGATIFYGKSDEKARTTNEQMGDTKICLTVYAPSFSKIEAKLIERIANHLALFIERERLQEVATDVLISQERQRLAQDLHDSVNQLLFSIGLTAKGAEQRAKDDTLKKPLAMIQQLSSEAMVEMRHLIWQLRPLGLEKGLIIAIETYAGQIQLPVSFSSCEVIRWSKAKEDALFPIVQEALNNCKKHANPSDVVVHMYKNRGTGIISIQDDGCGIKETNAEGFGMKHMKERAKQIGGMIHVRSQPGEGTVISIHVPFDEEEQG